MTLVLPLCFVFWYALLLDKQGGRDRSDAFLMSATFVGAAVVAVTELLSLVNGLRFVPVLLTWTALAVFLAVKSGRATLTAFRPRRTSVEATLLERAMAGYLLVVLGVTAVLAAKAPPNTWDSMTYHMSRVAHWVQDGSVTFYPTAILRQLHSNPWAEFAILQTQILSHGDRFANIVQWFSMAGSLVGVAAVAREFGADRRSRWFAAVVCASIPMGILQATSTQTDYAAAFWLVCTSYFLLRIVKGAGRLHYVAFGLALGIAILTKGTAYVFAFPFVAAFCIWLAVRRDVSGMKFVALAFALAAVVNVGHWTRNFELYGSPLGPGVETGGFYYSNSVFGVAPTVSNMVRNAALHLGTTTHANEWVEAAVTRVHEVIGMPLDDARTTFYTTRFQVLPVSLNEDDAGNTLHFVLILLAGACYLWRRHRNPVVTAYALGIVVAYVAFCAYLRWQPWNSRLHLPLFVLWAPFIGFVAGKLGRPRLIGVMAGILAIASLAPLLWSIQKPAFGTASVFRTPRDRQYFSKRPDIYLPYLVSSRFLRDSGCRRIGLMIGSEDWEYPVWKFVTGAKRSDIRITHVAVSNVSARLGEPDGANAQEGPCAIFREGPDRPPTFELAGSTYRSALALEPLTVYMRER